MQDQVLDGDFIKKGTGVDMREARFAGFWVRVVASIIDSLIFIPLSLVDYLELAHWEMFGVLVFIAVLNMFYKVYMEWKYQATLGKMALKIKVVSEGGGEITFEQSLVRYSLYFMAQLGTLISTYMAYNQYDVFVSMGIESASEVQNRFLSSTEGFATFPLLISCSLVAFDLRRQSLHDKMAKTYVIYDDAKLME